MATFDLNIEQNLAQSQKSGTDGTITEKLLWLL